MAVLQHHSRSAGCRHRHLSHRRHASSSQAREETGAAKEGMRISSADADLEGAAEQQRGRYAKRAP
jgi:hypothetical protein